MVYKTGRQCEFCAATSTPIWRRGPNGKGTLCNACGVKWGLRQRQSQGSVKKSHKKAKNGQVEPLPVVFDHSLQVRPSRAAKSVAQQQLGQEFPRNSNEEGSPLNSPDSDEVVSEDYQSLNLFEHLLFVAESKFMKERELASVREGLTELQSRILEEIERRSQFLDNLTQKLVEIQTHQMKVLQKELARRRDEIAMNFAREMETINSPQNISPLDFESRLKRIANFAEERLRIAEENIPQAIPQFDAASLLNNNEKMNREASESLKELSQLLAALPSMPVAPM